MLNSTMCKYNVLTVKQSIIATAFVEQFKFKRQSNMYIYFLVSRVLENTCYLLISPLAPAGA